MLFVCVCVGVCSRLLTLSFLLSKEESSRLLLQLKKFGKLLMLEIQKLKLIFVKTALPCHRPRAARFECFEEIGVIILIFA